jgi:hypothetical protein
MSDRFENNQDWIKRDKGRIPTKGAMAAERASAGLGTSDDDAPVLREQRPGLPLWAPVRKSSTRAKAK